MVTDINGTCVETDSCISIDEYCDAINCTNYDTPDFAIKFKYILWGNWLTSLLVTVFSIAIMYKRWILTKALLPGWPYTSQLYCIRAFRLKGIIHIRLLKFIFFLKIVPSMIVDVVDILFDNIYYDELVSNAVMSTKIHLRPFVYIILFVFQITGTIKNMILARLAWIQLTPKDSVQGDANGEENNLTKRLSKNPNGESPRFKKLATKVVLVTKGFKSPSKYRERVVKSRLVDESESILTDMNAYMAITFYQSILAFVLQDAPEALTQYFFVDKFLKQFNWIAVIASAGRFLMSCRTMFIFSRYVYNFVDPAYHSCKIMCLLWSMVLVKFIIFCTHALRSMAVVLTNSKELSLSCLYHEENIIYQDQWNFRCMDATDTALACLCLLCIIGVIFGVFVAMNYGETIYSQSHYSGRVGVMSRESDDEDQPQRKTPIFFMGPTSRQRNTDY